VIVALLPACGNAWVLLPERDRAPRMVQDACHMTEIKCASCHTLERIRSSLGRSRADWDQQVRQMRLKASSGISEGDAGEIVTCLVYVDSSRPSAAL
jgi:hypothetical protein